MQGRFLLGVAVGGLALATARPAAACGGFFCDNPGPTSGPPMPVDQTGETIVFVLDGNNVEAHIQIQYTGDPERFAWLIPLQAVPEVTVGSARLFANLLNGSVPTVSVSTSFDACNGNQGSSRGGCAFGAASDDEATAGSFRAGSGGTGGMNSAPPPVDVNVEVVGAFEVATLTGSSAAIETWLVDNGYLPDDEAPAIVDDYASRGYVFAAIKLRAGAGLDELHPLVIKYPGTEPCIPLKLTAIAAKEDMAVRAFFLGERRTVPTSYRHVSLNFARLDWTNPVVNYTNLVSQAVDSPGAAGQAFVTEYAGPSNVVSTNGLSDVRWNSASFAAIGALDVVDELERQGLMNCSSQYACEATHPQVLPILRNYLPAPAGVSENQFWSCTSCYAGQFDATTFDSAAFAQDIDARIIQPGRHATQLIGRWPYLTRLFTTISPSEMTADPAFVQLPASKSLPDVSPALNATDRTTCDFKQVMNLPDGREIVHAPNAWPSFDSDMPWAERVEEFNADGSSIVLADFSPQIDTKIQEWNTSQGWDPGSGDRAQLAQTHGGGCACGFSTPPSQGVAYLALAALGLLRRGARRRNEPEAGA